MKKAFLCLGIALFYSFLPHSLFADEARYELHLASGIAAMNTLDFLNAIKEFENALKEKPSDLKARFYLGFCYNRLGNQKKAIPILEEIVKEDPSYIEAREELGIAFYYAREYLKARELLQKVREEQPENAQACQYLGLTWLAMDDFDRAKELLSSAAKLDPSYEGQGAYQMGLAYLAKNRVEEAVERFELTHQLLPASEEGMEAASMASSLRQRAKPRRIWGDVRSRYEYDDNVVLNPNDSRILDISDQADWRYSTTFTLNLAQPVNKYMDIESRYQFVQSVHNHLGDFNLLGNDLLNGVQFKLPHASPYVGYRYEYYFLDDCKQSYLRSNTVIASFTIPETWRAFTIPFYNFRKDAFMLPFVFDEDNRSAFNHTVGIDQYFLVTEDARRWLRGGVYYDRNDAEGINYVYNGLKLSGELSTALVGDVFLNFEAEYYIRNYMKSTFHRYDDQQNYTVTLARRINKYLELGLQYELVVNDSTVALFQYQRDIYSMLATLRY